MCPVCLATAAVIATKASTTGGLAALIVKKVLGKPTKENPHGN